MIPVKFVYAEIFPIAFCFGIMLARCTTKVIMKGAQRDGTWYPRLWVVLRAMFLICRMAASACGASRYGWRTSRIRHQHVSADFELGDVG